MFRLKRIAVSVVALSGTLPPHIEDGFWKAVYGVLAPLERPALIMTKPMLPNHFVTVTRPLDSEVAMQRLPELMKHVDEQILSLDSRFRAVVFVRTKAMGDDLVKRLGCLLYTAGLNGPDQEKVLSKWREAERGSQQVLVATTALLQGMDMGYVQFIAFVSVTFGLVNMMQGIGRGGRKGKSCYVVSISPKNVRWDDPGNVSMCQEGSKLPELRQCLREYLCSQMVYGLPRGMPTCLDKDKAVLESCGFCEKQNVANRMIQSSLRQPGFTMPSSDEMKEFFEGLRTEPVITDVAPLERAPSPTQSASMAEHASQPAPPDHRLLFRTVSQPGPSTIRPATQPSGLSRSASESALLDSEPLTDFDGSSVPISVGTAFRVLQASEAEVEAGRYRERLTHYFRMLMGKCPVCWVCRGEVTQVYAMDGKGKNGACTRCFLDVSKKVENDPSIVGDPDGSLLRHAKAKESSKVVYGLKMRLSLPKYHHCYFCCLPGNVEELRRTAPDHERNARSCTFDNIAVYVLFASRMCPDIWSEVVTEFVVPGQGQGLYDLVGWLCENDGRGGGLLYLQRLVCWVLDRRMNLEKSKSKS